MVGVTAQQQCDGMRMQPQTLPPSCHVQHCRPRRAPEKHAHAVAAAAAPAAPLLCCRYRLASPSAAYAASYESLQRKQDLALRCRAALLRNPAAPAEQLQQQVLAGGAAAGGRPGSSGSSSSSYQLPQLVAEALFLARQLTAMQEVCCGAGLAAGLCVSAACHAAAMHALLLPLLQLAHLPACYRCCC